MILRFKFSLRINPILRKILILIFNIRFLLISKNLVFILLGVEFCVTNADKQSLFNFEKLISLQFIFSLFSEKNRQNNLFNF